MNEFYVYECIRLDTNEPFYIGKGTGYRWRTKTKRKNNYFNNIAEKYGFSVIILHNNLTEQEAHEIECWYIWQLRDVQGYWLANMTDGGEGAAGYKHNKIFKDRMSGEGNPMYGIERPDTSERIKKITL